jgi:acyl-homoserine lactone acylase PvdQ
MRRLGRQGTLALVAACAIAIGAAGSAGAQLPGLPGLPGLPADTPVQPYGTNDGGGFWNILPPGQNGHANAVEIGAFLAACPPPKSNCPNAPRPMHSSKELQMYGDLVYASPGLSAADIPKYFKDASFGVKQNEAQRIYSPPGRDDVTIVRDSNFGVPHIYGKTRPGTMFALGYAGAEDRLFVMDALRNAGRAQLSAFAGGAAGNRAQDHTQWEIAPYTEADLQRQFDLGDEVYGPEGVTLQDDVTNYVAGINRYIAEARVNPLKMPGEYAAIGRPGPQDWKVTDVIATASLVGGIFGKGGGGELDSALLLQDAQKRFGRVRGKRVWADLRTAEDPEAPVTVNRKRFPYRVEPRKLRSGGVALPDRGSVRELEVAPGSGASAAGRGGASAAGRGGASAAGRSDAGLGGLLGGFPRQGSNALLVSARESESGKPLAVMGPQTAYFAPQLLLDVDVHGPGIDARGATFAGVSLYVLLGRGRDYAWSATSAGQDIIDTFAVPLCEPDGSAATVDSMHYVFRGQCTAIEVLEKTNSWTPSPADDTPPGSEKLHAERTKLGLVTARATVKGKPVAYTKLRSTYFHEADSARGFADLNNPDKIRGPQDFQRAASKIGFTFNWFYVDHSKIAYFNSGNNPVRARRTSTHFPVGGQFEWQGWNPDMWSANYTPDAQHPQVIDQAFLANWNNKQARAYRAGDDNFAYGPTYRSQSLSDRIRKGTRGSAKMSLVELIDAMESAGTVDLRATKVLPWALRVIGKPRDPKLRSAVRVLRAWVRAGGHRLDRDRNGVYERTEAISILDRWWPRWLRAEFRPALGAATYKRLQGMLRPDDDPNLDGEHHGSAYNGGWYHYAQKDLRRALGRRVKRPLSRVYCGGSARRQGNLRSCRARLRASLKRALAADPAVFYKDSFCEGYGLPSDQWCFDAVRQRPVGAVNQPLIHWINRPTFQQVIEVQKQAPR